MLNYDPHSSPLELPVQLLIAHCIAEAPLYLPPRSGSTPGTTLFGAFGRTLWDCTCARRQQGLLPCNTKPPRCLSAQRCPIPWLYKPYSEVHHRTMARPILLRAPALEANQPVTEFELKVTLWGRHAIAERDAVLETLRMMGLAGLRSAGVRVRFAVEAVDAKPVMTLAERAKTLASRAYRQALLTFETPFIHQEWVRLEGDRRERLFMAGGLLPLEGILANSAYELTAWDIEDREVGEMLDQKGRHDLARRARHIARSTAEGLNIIRCNLAPTTAGTRLSKVNGRYYPLKGFQGIAEIEGDLTESLPWLIALSLGGGGQKRAMGFGAVRLWFGTTENRCL